MARTYRGNGAWGIGKGSNLTEAEFDNNTYTDQLAIQDLIDNPAEAVSVDGFVLNGSQFSWTLTDATQLGPFTFPVIEVTAPPWRRIADATYATVLADNGRMLKCSAGCTVLLSSTLYLDGAEIHVMQDSGSAVVFDHDSGCTLDPPTGDDTRTARAGAVAHAKWNLTDLKWHLWGDLAPVSA